MAAVLKTVERQRSGGSNPSASAQCNARASAARECGIFCRPPFRQALALVRTELQAKKATSSRWPLHCSRTGGKRPRPARTNPSGSLGESHRRTEFSRQVLLNQQKALTLSSDQPGEMSEWLKEPASKTGVRQRTGGSNPSLTAITILFQIVTSFTHKLAHTKAKFVRIFIACYPRKTLEN